MMQGGSISLHIATISFLMVSLDISEIGYLGLYQSITTILPRVIGLGSTSYIVSQAVKKTSMILRKELCVLLMCMIFLSCVSIVLTSVYNLLTQNSMALLIVSVGVISSIQLSFFNLQSAFLIQSSRVFVFLIVKLSYLALIFISTVIVFNVFDANVENRLYIILIFDLAFIFYRLYIFRRFLRLLPLNQFYETFKYLTQYGIPIIISACFGWVFFDFDKIFFARNFDIAAVGLLTTAIWAGSLLNTFNDVLRQSCIPWFRRWCKNKFSFKGYILIYIIHVCTLSLVALLIYETLVLISFFNGTAMNLIANDLLMPVLIFYVIFGSFFTTATLLEYFSLSKVRMHYLILFALVKIILSFVVFKIYPEKTLIYICTIASYFFFTLMINITIYRRVKPTC
jgi:O-antigen/teichoic acid export membrane protein